MKPIISEIQTLRSSLGEPYIGADIILKKDHQHRLDTLEALYALLRAAASVFERGLVLFLMAKEGVKP